jgi:hypothetical protein
MVTVNGWARRSTGRAISTGTGAPTYSRPMAFFEPPQPVPEPSPPAAYGPPIWTGPSELLLGAWVPAQQLLAKTESAAVVLRGLCAYPNGFEVQVSFLSRPPQTPQLHQQFFTRYQAGHGPRFGFEFSDGRRVGHSTEHGGFDVPKDDNGIPTEPVLLPRGGGGGGGEWKQTFWVWPLPPPGRLVLHFDWPDQKIPDTSVELDGREVRQAGENAVELWSSGRTLLPDEAVVPGFGGGTRQQLIATARLGDDKPKKPGS